MPEKPEVTVAWGCALATESLLEDTAEWHTVEALLQRMQGRAGQLRLDESDLDRPFFLSDDERGDFFDRQLQPEPIRNIPRDREPLDVWIGIYSGSTTSKFVFLDGQGTPVYSYYSNNRGAPLKVLSAALIEAREHARARGTELNVLGV